MTHRAFYTLLLVALPLACGAPDPRVVVRADAPIVVEPTPDGGGFDPRSARLRAAAREVERVAGHAVVLHVDGALVSNDARSLEESLGAATSALAQALAYAKETDPDAFALAVSAAPSLDRVAVRYAPLVPRGAPTARVVVEGKGGRALVIELSDRIGSGRELAPRGAILEAILDAYDDATEARFRGAPPDPAHHEAYFAWLTRTRPGRGSVVVHRAALRARGSDESRQAARRDAEARVRLAVLRLEERAAPELRARIEAWLVAELPRVAEGRAARQGALALLSRDDVVFEAERAYGRWVARRLRALPERGALLVADALFPRGRLCDEDDRAPACRAVLPPEAGVDRTALGLSLLGELERAGFDPARTEHPALVTRVLCPARRDPLGRTHDACNPSFAASALATTPARARLVQALVDSRSPRLVAEVAATLHYARPEDVRALLAALDGHPALYKEAVRALVFGLSDRHRLVLDDEARRAWARGDAEHRAAALTILAESRGKLHPHYADGFFSRFAAEWGSAADAATVDAMLAGAPRLVAAVPRVWLGLAPGARAEPVISSVDALIATPDDALEEPAQATLTAVIARLCADHASADLARLRRALEAATQRHPEAGRRVANALDDAAPGRCARGAGSR